MRNILLFVLLMSTNNFAYADCKGSSFTEIEKNLKVDLKRDLAQYQYGDGDSPVYKVKEAQIGSGEQNNIGYAFPLLLKLEQIKNPNKKVQSFGVFLYSNNCKFKNAIIGQEAMKINF